jgi:hypothetical protein
MRGAVFLPQSMQFQDTGALMSSSLISGLGGSGGLLRRMDTGSSIPYATMGQWYHARLLNTNWMFNLISFTNLILLVLLNTSLNIQVCKEVFLWYNMFGQWFRIGRTND